MIKFGKGQKTFLFFSIKISFLRWLKSKMFCCFEKFALYNLKSCYKFSKIFVTKLAQYIVLKKATGFRIVIFFKIFEILFFVILMHTFWLISQNQLYKIYIFASKSFCSISPSRKLKMLIVFFGYPRNARVHSIKILLCIMHIQHDDKFLSK